MMTKSQMPGLTVHLRKPHRHQARFIKSKAKRKIVRAGRRGGKTIGAATLAVQAFLDGQRVLYGVPTQEQVEKFWFECKRALAEPLDRDVLYKNETSHVIELPGTEQRIRAKTCWDANTLRGDYADLLILDEFQLMSEDTWGEVGAPMLLDNDGDAVLVYTPPSLRTASRSKARDPRHAAKMFKAALADKSGRWEAFHFTSHDNPYISKVALAEIVQDMTSVAHRQEIMAEDLEDAPGALWKRADIDRLRLTEAPELAMIVVAVDPSATSTGDECGIVVGGIDRLRPAHGYLLADRSKQASPDSWALAVLQAYVDFSANKIVYEANQGGDMVRVILLNTVKAHPELELTSVKIEAVIASKGKRIRAEPVSVLYEQSRVHHVGGFPYLEDELAQWVPTDTKSPNRLDACVWLFSSLMLKPQGVLLR